MKNDWKCQCGWNFSETSIEKIQPEENSLGKLVAYCCQLVEAEPIAINRKSPFSDLSLSQISLLMISTALSLYNPGDSLYQLNLPSTNRDLHRLLSKSTLVYQSESRNLSYFIEWFDHSYRLEYKRFGQRKNHLEKLSLIATFGRKLEDLYLQ